MFLRRPLLVSRRLLLLPRKLRLLLLLRRLRVPCC